MSPAILSLGIGSAITLVSLLVPYQYCHNGRARGLPFATIIPACEATPASFGLGHLEGVQVVDAPRALGNLTLWTGLAYGVVGIVRQRRRDRWSTSFGCSRTVCGR